MRFMENTFSASSNKVTPERSSHCLLIIWRKLRQKNLCYHRRDDADNSLLQCLKKKNRKKTTSDYHDQKYLPQPCAAKTLKMRLGTDLQQDILLLRIPPLLFMDKGKLENDVYHKINKLSPKPSVLK